MRWDGWGCELVTKKKLDGRDGEVSFGNWGRQIVTTIRRVDVFVKYVWRYGDMGLKHRDIFPDILRGGGGWLVGF